MPERKWERAVSPVVGVMLMLVVTIIIAAIVSAFAGNALEGTDQAPQATIQGICYVNSSQQNLVVLTHMGGDSLVPSRTEVVIKKGDEWGSYTGILSGYTQQISKTKISDSNGKLWLNATSGGTEVLTWRPGETMYIAYSGISSSDIGKSLDLEISTVDGKLISHSKIMVIA